MLPSNKRLQRSVLSNAENYIVADGLLFRLYETYRNKQLIRRCLLVIPETHEHVIFQHYHDSLLGAHYGPLNTFYTIRDKYYIPICLIKLINMFLHVMTVKNKKPNDTRIDISIPEYPYHIILWHIFRQISNTCLKVYMAMNFF